MVAAAVLLTGCGGNAKPPVPTPTATATPAPPTDTQLLERAIARRGDTLEASKRVRRLEISSAHYIVRGVRIDGAHARLRVRLSYGVRGVAGDFGANRTLLARRRGGRWRITGAAGRRSEDPWDVDDYTAERSPHFVVWTPDGIPAPVTALEVGYKRLREVLDRGRLRRRYLVVVARDAERARRLTERISGLESLTALTDTQAQLDGPALAVAEIASQRLIVNQAQFALGDADAQRTVITHELTHAALAPVTSGRVPGWLVEGVALYVSEDDRRAEAARDRSVGAAPTLSSLSAPDAFGRLTGPAQAAAYATASAAAYGIAERYGRDGLLQLYEAFGSEHLRGRRGDPRTTERAVRRVLGLSLDELQSTL